MSCGAQNRLVASDHGMHQWIGEFAPDRGADLRDLLHRREAIEPGHQAVLEGRGDCERRQRSVEAEAFAVLHQQPGFQHVLGQLLHEQRHAVGLGDDLREHFRRQLAPTRDALDECLGFGAIEPLQRDRTDVGQAFPRRLEFRPEGDQEQHGQPPRALDHEIEHFERGRVRPLRVLEKDEHWLFSGQPLHLVEQRRKRLTALLRRGQGHLRIAVS
jgi:hypothetical protein